MDESLYLFIHILNIPGSDPATNYSEVLRCFSQSLHLQAGEVFILRSIHFNKCQPTTPKSFCFSFKTAEHWTGI